MSLIGQKVYDLYMIQFEKPISLPCNLSTNGRFSLLMFKVPKNTHGTKIQDVANIFLKTDTFKSAKT